MKEFTEKEKLSVLTLSYIAKQKLNDFASVDLLDLLKLLVLEDNNLHSLTWTQSKGVLGNCFTNIYDYSGKIFSIFAKDDNFYQCSTIILMVKKINARDYTMVEIYKVQLRSRETLINNVDFNNNTIGYDNCKFIMY